LPRAVEVTEEPTKVATPTQLSGSAQPKAPAIDSKAPTELTDHGKPIAHRELRKVSTTNVVPLPPRSRSRIAWLAAVALLVALVIVAIVVRMKPSPENAPVKETPPVTASNPVPAPPGRVALNAFPWGEVTSIRNVATGAAVALKEAVTPVSLDLAPGTYEITMSNPSFASPITRKVEVKGGAEQPVNVQFADPATATLPRFQDVAP
jgi:hypothetical protein